jgi:hypothetical protein
VITITGISDHLRLEWPITITGMRSELYGDNSTGLADSRPYRGRQRTANRVKVRQRLKNQNFTLNNACRKWGAREIRLRYLPKPSLNRWIAEALIDHHPVIEKIRADIARWRTHLTKHRELQRSADCPRGGRYGNRRDQDHVAFAMASADKWVGASLFPTKIDDCSEGPQSRTNRPSGTGDTARI